VQINLSGLKRLFGSRRLIYFLIGLLVIQAAWIALSALYPQAFDENYHFGLIKVYSHYWLPFFSSQPPHANAFGAVARDPSYLYHYLMSWPYRLIKLFIGSPTGQIIILRFINIGLFSLGLLASWKLLIRCGLSIRLVNLLLFLFVLVPIMPQLAGQINYDNLLFPLVGYILLLGLRVVEKLKARRVPAGQSLVLLSLCLLASLVKYEFLPIFLAVVIYIGWTGYRSYHLNLRGALLAFKAGFTKLSRPARVGLCLLVLISLGMFMERYGVDLVRYHSIEPHCGRVLGLKACSQYPPWYYE